MPITTSTAPDLTPSAVSLASFVPWKRDSGLTRSGNPENRSVKVS